MPEKRQASCAQPAVHSQQAARLPAERVERAVPARGQATAARRRALLMIRLVFDYVIRDRRLPVNVARMVALPRGGTKREPHWLRPEQLGRLAMAVPPQCQPVVLFLSTTGCRFSEMVALRVDDVVQTPQGLGVRVHRAATQSKRTSRAVFGPTKTHQARTVPVPAALGEYVRTRVGFTTPGGYMFPSPRGGVNRPGFHGGSRSTEDESHGSTEEVPGRASGPGDPNGARGAA
jgi:integrase